MGSKLLYGLSFCVILWWLIRYYLIPLWRQNQHSNNDSSRRIDLNEDTSHRAQLPAQSKVNNSGKPAQSAPHVYSESDNSAVAENAVSDTNLNSQHRRESVPSESSDSVYLSANDPLNESEDDIDLNATTDLQGQLEVLHLEKERTRSGGSTQPAYEPIARDNVTPAVENYSLDLQDQTDEQLREHVILLEKQVDENNRDITMLCSELKDARQYESKFNENDKRIAEYQTLLSDRDDALQDAEQRLSQLNIIEEKLEEKNRRLKTAQDQIRTLQAAADRVPGLEASIGEKENSINQFRAQQNVTVSLQSAIATKDQEIKQLRADLKQVQKLETTLQEKERVINRQTIDLQETQSENHRLLQTITQLNSANDDLKHRSNDAAAQLQQNTSTLGSLEASLKDKTDENSKLASENTAITEKNETLSAQKTQLERSLEASEEKRAQLESRLAQYADGGTDSQRTQSESGSLAKLTAENEHNQQRIRELSQALSEAEQALMLNNENDLELRRLRSELQSLTQQKSNSSQQIASLQNQISEQQQLIQSSSANGQRTLELKQLESVIKLRDGQIADLKHRLEQQLSAPTHQPGSHQGTASRPAQTTNQPGLPERKPALVPLFTAPDIKDDLKLIKGIGPVMERTLNSLGVTSFKQLCEFSQHDINRVSAALDTFPGRIERDDWVGGAKLQYQKKYAAEIEA